MLLAIVNRWLVALERSLVNPLQAFALIFGNTCASHQEPACSKLCLGITSIGCQLIPLSVPIKWGSGVSKGAYIRFFAVIVCLVSLFWHKFT